MASMDTYMDSADDVWFTNIHIPALYTCMNSADDVLFTDIHIPMSVFAAPTETETNKLVLEIPDIDLSSRDGPPCSWESTNNALLSPYSFSGATSSTQSHANSWLDVFVRFVDDYSKQSQIFNESMNEMDQIMLELSYEYPLPIDLDDGSLMYEEIEKEFQSIRDREDEVINIYAEYYGCDPSISIVYSDIDDDYILCPKMDWTGINDSNN